MFFLSVNRNPHDITDVRRNVGPRKRTLSRGLAIRDLGLRASLFKFSCSYRGVTAAKPILLTLGSVYSNQGAADKATWEHCTARVPRGQA